jgi:hypothetical protein
MGCRGLCCVAVDGIYLINACSISCSSPMSAVQSSGRSVVEEAEEEDEDEGEEEEGPGADTRRLLPARKSHPAILRQCADMQRKRTRCRIRRSISSHATLLWLG